MEPQEKTTTITFSFKSVLKVIIAIGIISLIFFMSDLILLMFIVGVLSVSLSPIVEKVKNRLDVPRIVAIAIIFALVACIIVISASTIIPPVIEQLKNIYTVLPEYLQGFSPIIKSVNGDMNPGASPEITNGVASGAYQSALEIFGGIASFVFILILTFLLLIEEGGLIRYILSILPINQKGYVIEVSKKINSRISAWFIGQLTIMVLTGILNTAFFLIIGVPYALTLGVIAFFLEAIPNIGPILAAIPAIVIAYTSAPWKALAVFIFTVVFHLIGGQFLVPKIMSKAIQISAFVIIVGLLAGGKIAGITGMILALPVITTISVINEEWPNIKRRIKKDSQGLT